VLTWRARRKFRGCSDSLSSETKRREELGKAWAGDVSKVMGEGAEACMWWAALRPSTGGCEVWVRLRVREWKIFDKIATWNF
jgi:hypothetical protein